MIPAPMLSLKTIKSDATRKTITSQDKHCKRNEAKNGTASDSPVSLPHYEKLLKLIKKDRLDLH
jgi:hypothetical protein